MNELSEKVQEKLGTLGTNSWFEKAKQKLNASTWPDTVMRYGKKSLPHVSRLLLVSTYLEDGVRMWYNWGSQRRYIEHDWSCGWYLATAFVLFNLVSQIVASVLVLCRKHATAACGVLLAVTVVQTIFYRILWNVNFFLRNFAVTGGVILLLADVKTTEGRRLFAGLPSAEDKTQARKPYMLLSGRLLLTLMFLTLLRLELTPLWITLNVVGLALTTMIAVGYKTTIAAALLAIWLSGVNVYAYAGWIFIDPTDSARDYYKYYFFQTLSMTGGLVLLIALGPGGISIDKRHKQL